MSSPIEITTYQDKQYKVLNGTYYHIETDDKIILLLEQARQVGYRVRLHYGDQATGRDWMDEHDVTGHLGRSMGPVKVPLIIKTKQSSGGPAILEHRIIRIRKLGAKARDLYVHDKYHQGDITYQLTSDKAYPYEVLIDGKVHARFKSRLSMMRWANKMVVTFNKGSLV